MFERRHDYLRFASFLGVAVAALVVATGCGHKKEEKQAKQETVVVRLKAVPAPGHRVTDQDLHRSVSIMRKRLRELGAPTASVRIDGPDVIAIELPKSVAANIRFASKTA